METVEHLQQKESTALWNPNAAANWSLLFSPAFGAYLQMLNWRTLGETELAAKSRTWFYVALGVLALYLILPFLVPDEKVADGAARGIALVFLFTWYFASARSQAKYVKARFGADYGRRPWGKALGLGVVAVISYLVIAILFGIMVGLASR